MPIITSRPLTAKEEKTLAVLQGALVGFVANGSIALVSPVDFAQIMHKPSVNEIRQAINSLMSVTWTPHDRPGNQRPIIMAYGSRDGVNAFLVEFNRAYVDALNSEPIH
ncbi:hypothetical protein [Pandoraea apista]|uniref:hypothetical protein n=1 Tax=Pandoraea apista TaxID=93218 RepID=UPI00065916BF|nr:hypothetical protein [Pandoraea apista]ALS68361.1 hypothetical protein AT395_24760 [Pandoraea apista]ALS68423.1 hypothetical protein AT395_25110 [Pandoraea apista]CFB60451.1 hypothetical protein LMG16407_00490 [Pandoraea apista]